ncbi:methane monooxygenase/ammonia monooxygenase subunit C [Bradyrhizobium brasilense]|uniref:bacterial ammonia monooxygenase, subunit AmoC n=1 Tax=Bradyrhizobium brasilense TaxID=1419277 RepID=UPI0024B040D8|nr:bacterial ammonia monooxygenase, subunit AmoC [Bradyrhizobium australafricanum]WFU31247.1 methane monooxygenase/ammonia monooxygenase subunit C [Bradyrhizobium australafricanum]
MFGDALPRRANVTVIKTFDIDYGLFAFAMVALTILYVSARLYQQAFGFSMGLDANSPEFDRYWMTLFRIELPVLYGAGVLCWSYLFLTRDRGIETVTPETELRRYFYLAMWLVVYSFCIFWTGSFFADGDGVWHQTTLRDTPLTPSHIILFYATIPIYLFFGIGSFVYAMTRIPAFCRGVSLMHVIAVVGPFLILPNLGFNEWGHAYWLTEEIFSHPLHWGFVVLGWCALALAGILMQIVERLRELIPLVFKQDAARSPTDANPFRDASEKCGPEAQRQRYKPTTVSGRRSISGKSKSTPAARVE